MGGQKMGGQLFFFQELGMGMKKEGARVAFSGQQAGSALFGGQEKSKGSGALGQISQRRIEADQRNLMGKGDSRTGSRVRSRPDADRHIAKRAVSEKIGCLKQEIF